MLIAVARAAVETAEAAVGRIVAAEQARFPVPGLSIGVLSSDEEWTAAFGVTSVDHPLEVTADTYFQIGSITKTFLGTLVMRLVEEGRLELDAPARRWVPELRLRDEDAAARATLRHLLTHTCGWFGDHFADFGPGDDCLERYVASMADLEQQVPLGAEWAYNNAAFALAGRVVERVTGRPVEAAMRELLFAPLGLARTYFFADEVVTFRVAAGHNVFDGRPRVARPWAIPRATNAVGGIVSTVPELLRYARFHMGDGRLANGDRYLSPEGLALAHSPLVPAATGLFRGIAWSVEDTSAGRVIGHNGATIGQQALLLVAPQRRAAVAMLTNSGQATQLQNAITRWWRDRFLGLPYDPPTTRAPSFEEAQRVAGHYVNPANEVEIRVDGGRLVFQQTLHGSLRALMEEPPPQPAPVELAFTRADRLIHLEGPLQDSIVELLGDPANALEWIRFGGRLYRRQ